MAPQAITFPSETVRVVETPIYILPIPGLWFQNIRICRHFRQVEDCLFVGDIWSSDFV